MNILASLSQTLNNFDIVILLLTAILHVIFASGVAKDVANFNHLGIPTQFIPGYAWVLATLIGGILVLAVYWLMHHSSLARDTFPRKGQRHEY